MDLLVTDLPMGEYLSLRKELQRRGYSVQGYQPKFWNNTKKELITDNKG